MHIFLFKYLVGKYDVDILVSYLHKYTTGSTKNKGS